MIWTKPPWNYVPAVNLQWCIPIIQFLSNCFLETTESNGPALGPACSGSLSSSTLSYFSQSGLGSNVSSRKKLQRHPKLLASWWFQPTHWKNVFVKLDQIGSFPQIFGVEIPKIFELPPPRVESWNISDFNNGASGMNLIDWSLYELSGTRCCDWPSHYEIPDTNCI